MATTEFDTLTFDELRLAGRNHAMPLEALRYDVTPVGLHYLLIHYDIPVVNPGSWQLEIDGAVEQGLQLSLDDLRRRPAVTQDVTLECAGTGRARLTPRALSQPWLHGAIGTGTWTGTPLRPLLEEAGLAADAVDVVFTGADRGVEGGIVQQYRRSLPVAEATRDEVVLAYELNGAPLPVQHGFPVRLLVPGWYGMTSVKWLERITVSTTAFDGYQQTVGYRFRQEESEPGEPVTRIAIRSLIAPPGIPDFMTRARYVTAGTVSVTGRAWSGRGAVTNVEFSADGGERWIPAEVHPARGPHAWHRWQVDWHARPGEYVLCCRATDETGETQPLEPPWNLGGYAVNDVHRVPVTVT